MLPHSNVKVVPPDKPPVPRLANEFSAQLAGKVYEGGKSHVIDPPIVLQLCKSETVLVTFTRDDDAE